MPTQGRAVGIRLGASAGDSRSVGAGSGRDRSDPASANMLAASPAATGTFAGSAIAGVFQPRNRRLPLRCSRRPIEAITNILWVIFPLPAQTKGLSPVAAFASLTLSDRPRRSMTALVD
jgi:hypothetical protein